MTNKIELDLETLHQEVEKAKNKFKRYFNIEPELLLVFGKVEHKFKTTGVRQ